MTKNIFIVLIFLILVSCQKNKEEKVIINKPSEGISDAIITQTINDLINKYGDSQKFRIERGVRQVAAFWQEQDGTKEDFSNFCLENFVNDSLEFERTFISLERQLENVEGNFNNMILNLRFPIDVDEGNEPTKLDYLFAAYNPAAHINDDYFNNKIAFFVLLNFPNYSLEEKNELGKNWSRKEWAMARIGDIFNSRIPADLLQNYSKISSETDNYINNYNIMMDKIIDKENLVKFPEGMKLISHWNLRDELKANYGKENGNRKQEIIYKIMERIITQEIPEVVINNNEVTWEPFENKVYRDNKEVEYNTEYNKRYKYLLQNFKALKDMDKYYPFYNTYIKRQFDMTTEMSFEEVEKMFIDFISSEEVKKTAELIEKRLGRKLRPYDIWYDGFKDRNSINIDEVTKKLKAKYPNKNAFEKDLVNILTKLGFEKSRASWVADKIAVDGSRGAGHASGSRSRRDKSHLRTRIGNDGMDYKGYNIAIHEFGHNVEQTFSLYNIDYYSLAGVPSNAFTEAFAFLFQSRDLKILGIEPKNPDSEYLNILDNLWSAYEIMGVALVDMYVWKWLYENPNASPEELKSKVIEIAIDVWNKYYANVIGEKDSPILAIYSHMIAYPLYLSAYPIGHLIEFQIEQFIKSKPFGREVERITSLGRLTPKYWMLNAVGEDLSIKPTLNSAKIAIDKLSKK